MNCKEANQIGIPLVLESWGYHPNKVFQDKLLYLPSPFRPNETKSSFWVHITANRWIDFARMEDTDTLVSLTCQLFNESISSALTRLRPLKNTSPVSFKYNPPPHIQKETNKTRKYAIELISKHEITHPALFDYLNERCINPGIAKQELEQVNYKFRNNEKEYFSLGMKNNSNGFEIDHKKTGNMKGNFKSVIGPKDITTKNMKNGNNVAIFEAYHDYLAFRTHRNLLKFQSSLIIMHSIHMKDRVIEELKKYKFKKAYFFLDSDAVGKETFQYLALDLKYPFVDKSTLYSEIEGIKDYNDWWIRKCGK